ncbi:hypothetical protein HYALB_00001008 [Hymenoscyphus albidus]|uniref:Uncharacterized protein n=1 Tax=Hymenoscyphus albidus TaxID=595503 RepID=A0A9N9QCP5_9HELO|nr:hypothetical protein HYALB_00001008 [Hymenoscyphus albidus]
MTTTSHRGSASSPDPTTASAMRNVDPASETLRDMTESRRALELRRFFSPSQYSKPSDDLGFNESLNNDGALDAYVETVLWRLRGKHAMVSLVDRGTQYFLAGSCRNAAINDDDDDVVQDSKWFGCSTVPTPGGLCENTLALDDATEYPIFVVPDLSKDERFANLPVVNGSVASFKFYAGAPITTARGVNIGSLFLFDDKPRDKLSLDHRKCKAISSSFCIRIDSNSVLHAQASNVMKHLESKREAAERRRVTLMSRGLAMFLEKTSEVNEVRNVDDEVDDSGNSFLSDATGREPSSILDKIRMTLDLAAEILKGSLELNVGGVVFLNHTESDYSDNAYNDAYIDNSTDLGKKVQKIEDSYAKAPPSTSFGGESLSQFAVRSSTDKHKPAKILSMSAAKIAAWDPESTVLDSKTLQTFIKTYPNGNVWYMDEEGYFTSLEQNQCQEKGNAPSSRKGSLSLSDATKQAAEAAMLGSIFRKAKQIIFLPLYDASGDRWYAGCFVWSLSAVPVFSVENEISYLSAFTNSVMVEINRLDAITANKVKGDFISSISHEFRSPLHGILASAEFLRDSPLDSSQTELISTIQTCGNTLLHTINHVLDHSKINTFEKTDDKGGSILLTQAAKRYTLIEIVGLLNGLVQKINLALLCEQTVNGMIAANEYRSPAKDSTAVSDHILDPYQPQTHLGRRNPLAIILDIESRKWYFKIHAGAVSRIIMNLFGNAQKYTDSGYIMVRLTVQKSSETTDIIKTTNKTLHLCVRDSGRGMTPEYMQRKLYQPFAQGDSFAPGVGLGLSIVWSIVNQLGGKIQVRSELGKGTDIEVTLPLEDAADNEDVDDQLTSSNPVARSDDAQNYIDTLCKRAPDIHMRIYRKPHESAKHDDAFWECIERYCSDWFGIQFNQGLSPEPDLIITDEHDPSKHSCPRVLYVHNAIVCDTYHDRGEQISADISSPVGPFKLARAILRLLDSKGIFPNRADVGTQTPLGSTEERLVLNGIKLTDYGFPPLSISEVTETPVALTDIDEMLEELVPAPLTPRKTVSSFNGLPLVLPPNRRGNIEIQAPVTAPIVVPQYVKPALAVSEIPPTSTSTGLRILAVDDNVVNLQLLKRYLQKRKQDTISTARNGLEAVEVFKLAMSDPEERFRRFDVVFMDISMPEMDGFEATRVIRRLESDAGRSVAAEKSEGNGDSDRRAYIVALTGLGSRKDRDLAVESGLDDFMTKPVSFVKIGEVLRRIAGEKERRGSMGG